MTLIEKLKANKRPWIFLTIEEKDCLRKANETGMVENLIYNGEWECLGKPWKGLGSGKNGTYRIKPDYQPEPEFEDLEIVKYYQGVAKQACWLGVWKEDYDFLPYEFTHLHCLPSLPNFNKFWFTDDLTGKECKVLYSDVSNARDQGSKVFARFRKEKP